MQNVQRFTEHVMNQLLEAGIDNKNFRHGIFKTFEQLSRQRIEIREVNRWPLSDLIAGAICKLAILGTSLASTIM